MEKADVLLALNIGFLHIKARQAGLFLEPCPTLLLSLIIKFNYCAG